MLAHSKQVSNSFKLKVHYLDFLEVVHGNYNAACIQTTM